MESMTSKEEVKRAGWGELLAPVEQTEQSVKYFNNDDMHGKIEESSQQYTYTYIIHVHTFTRQEIIQVKIKY